MDKSGRITIPKLTLKQLGNRRPDVSLTGAVMLVRLEPA
jgi:bifunctional DNA-binding transcriptional regulator/antitoxin component of YhaV-PrlF toxin-antitoxin module